MNKEFKIDHNKALPKEYFLQKTEFIARDIIGKYLVKIDEVIAIAAKIVETEAYLSTGDLSSHSAPGITKRNRAMFEQGGSLYVYKIYGIHHCSNITSEEEGAGCAILLRAAEPVLGIKKMIENRKTDDIKKLCKGPGNLAKAYNFTLDDYGRSVCSDSLFIQSEGDISDDDIITTKRIGITKSTDLPLRFLLKVSEYVSGSLKR